MIAHQGTESLIELAQELRESQAEVADFRGRKRAMDVMERAAAAIERLAPLDPQIDRLEDVEKELAAMTHCYNIECANHKSSREQLYAMVKEQGAQPELAASKAREQQLRIAMFNTASACRIWGGEAERARKMLEDYLALP